MSAGIDGLASRTSVVFYGGTIAALRYAGAQTPHREHFINDDPVRLESQTASGLLWMIQIVVVMFLYWGHDRVPAVWGWLLCGLGRGIPLR